MEILEMFVGKNVTVTVSFSGAYADGGSVPKKFRGVLRKVENDFCLFSDIKMEEIVVTTRSYVNYSNSVVINKQYIIMIAEV